MTSGGTTNLTAPSTNFLLVPLTSLIVAGGGLTSIETTEKDGCILNVFVRCFVSLRHWRFGNRILI